MKARFVTKAALSALTLAFAGTLPGMAQQTASQPLRLLIRLKPPLLKGLL